MTVETVNPSPDARGGLTSSPVATPVLGLGSGQIVAAQLAVGAGRAAAMQWNMIALAVGRADRRRDGGARLGPHARSLAVRVGVDLAALPRPRPAA